jgi:sugar phosphate isomerase/epimerase
MSSPSSAISRRTFTRVLVGAGAVAVLARSAEADDKPDSKKTPLGIDNFAVRAMGWKADALIEYAASLEIDSLLISDLDALENFETGYLSGLRSKAADKGLGLHLGTWSICPTSKTFKNKWGTAEEHLTLGIRTAKLIGSPVLRVVLGNGEDRRTPGGIKARIADTVKVCKACRSQAIDAGVTIAVENHAGDMQSAELVQLIEAAGKDYVGANMDSGNAVWALEDPLTNLENLGPYAATTSLRDSAMWLGGRGAFVQWTAMGEGDTDLKSYFARFAELCPTVAVHIETISGFAREFPVFEDDFWSVWPDASARSFARWLAIAKRGNPRSPNKTPEGIDPKVAEQNYQKGEVERSIKFCKESLGLGLKS